MSKKLIVAFVVITTIIATSWVVTVFLSVVNVPIHLKPKSNVRSSPPDDKLDRLFWFLQVSDLHISRFYDPKRGPDLQEFCSKYVDIIKPSLVLATGDLTDAKHADLQGSEQFKDEWETYNRILKETKVTEKTVWLDLRGNHDAFNVPSLNSKKNYFRHYSNQGHLHPASYHHIHKTSFGEYSFIAVDAIPDPGLKRPFNFVGLLKKDRLQHLSNLATNSQSSNVTIWFGHYPSSVIVSEKPTLRDIIKGSGSAYLCGHLHTLADIVPNMYTMQKEGFLELELGDWKDNRIYRLAAIDHDMFSFTDTKLREWPLVLITNPKDALFNLPKKEPVQIMTESTHIRILSFSLGDITSVLVEVDSVLLGDARHVEGPLYVLPWQPKDYSRGLHNLKVTVQDSLGHIKTIRQSFSLDNTRMSFDLLPRLVLMTDWMNLMIVQYFSALLLATVPLVFFRIYQNNLYIPPMCTPSMCSCVIRMLQSVITRLHLVAVTGALYYPLILYAVYITIGPWFVGEFLSGELGLCFVFGVYTQGTFIPSDLTYAYGFWQIVLFNIPLTLYLGWCLQFRYKALQAGKSTRSLSVKHFLKNHYTFILIISFQAWCAYGGFYKAYGFWALLVGPMRTWSVILAIFLRRTALSIPKQQVEHMVMNGNSHEMDQ